MAAAPMFSRLLLVAAAWALPCGAERASLPGSSTVARHFDAQRGVPKLDVLRTSTAEEAEAFLEGWSNARDFGLFVQLAPDTSFLFQQRVAVLGICRDSRVLLYDLRPFFRQPPQPLPPALTEFLQDGKRTFLGMGLLRPVAHLAKEFEIRIRSIDLRVQGWPQVSLEGGLYRTADRLLGVSFVQRPSLMSLRGQAVYTYLQWAVANYCRSSFGKPLEEWVLTEAQLSGVNATKVRTFRPKSELSGSEEAEGHVEQLMRRRAALRQKEGRGTFKDKRERFATAREVRVTMRQLARGIRAGQ